MQVFFLEKISSAPKNIVLHVPYPASDFVNNPAKMCESMLFHKSKADVEEWRSRCRFQSEEHFVLDLETAFKLAKLYFMRHHSPEWKHWNHQEIEAMFTQIGISK